MRTKKKQFWTHTRYWQSVLAWFVLFVVAIDTWLVVSGKVRIGEALTGPIPLLIVFLCIWRLALPWFKAADRDDE